MPRYSSDVTDEELAIVVLRLPGPNRLGRPREIAIRAVWDAIQYIASAGCGWSLPPRDFPSVATVRSCFHGCRDNGLLGACLGLLAEINRELVALAREAEGRKCQPTAGVIDSQSAKPSENGGGSGYDAGHRIKGRKRHIMTDTCGHPIAPRVHSASIQDRDGADDALRVLSGCGEKPKTAPYL